MEIVVSNKASQPLYEQIASQVTAAIMSGALSAGEPLPSERAMAKSLRISILPVPIMKRFYSSDRIKMIRLKEPV